MKGILQDPLKLTMLIILAALEIPAMIFLIVAWIKAKKEYENGELSDGQRTEDSVDG